MLLVWENASPELPELIRTGKAPRVPRRVLTAAPSAGGRDHDAARRRRPSSCTTATRSQSRASPTSSRTPPATRSSARAAATCTLVRMTPDIVYDQLIGAGCADAADLLVGRQPGRRVAAPLPRRRRERLAAAARDRGAQPRRHGRPLRGRRVGPALRRAARLRRHRPRRRTRRRSRRSRARSPASVLTAVPALNPDVAIIHAQQADRAATCSCGAWSACRRRRCSSARRSIVTVEEVVDELTPGPNAVVLPTWVVDAVCEVPGGAHPSFAMGYSSRDNAFYQAWDDITRDRGDVHRLDRQARPRHGRLRASTWPASGASRRWPSA